MCVHRSTSALTSARADSKRGLDRMLAGSVVLLIASKAECESKVAVLRGAFTRDTTSFRVFLVYFLKAEVMSGNGGFHFMVFPRSPWVPIMQSQSQRCETSGWRGWQMVYVSRADVATGGEEHAVTWMMLAVMFTASNPVFNSYVFRANREVVFCRMVMVYDQSSVFTIYYRRPRPAALVNHEYIAW